MLRSRTESLLVALNRVHKHNSSLEQRTNTRPRQLRATSESGKNRLRKQATQVHIAKMQAGA